MKPLAFAALLLLSACGGGEPLPEDTKSITPPACQANPKECQ